ncbi:anti sigma factor C-terminal domain-containing protein [Planomicrobium sp. CPCC 101079]|uniref:anti sigma factor C-terminal domain-containing protein n=1 Tax=Planomicrobium sp. CPCC 101079 TaxID=2599618 RepID=UPI001647E642|nr:anti sigma factor C-terminal domain-containing protein [Planomicrobium sp. CPCC 101079]
MTRDRKELNLEEMFQEGNSNDSFSKIIGKARRKTIIRNIIVSALVLFFLIIVFGFSWLSIMRWSEANAINDIQLFSEITDPNIQEAGPQQVGNGFFQSILTFDRYKELEGIPVDWSSEVVTYSLFGGVSGFAGDYSPIQIEKAGGGVKSFDRETKQRLLEFYHPEVEYKEVANEISQLADFPEQTVAELSLSLDKNYSVEEIRQMIPERVTLKWFWVDTYSADDIDRIDNRRAVSDEELYIIDPTPELATQVYGFDEFSEHPELSVKGFIEDINMGLSNEKGKYFGEYERIAGNLKGGSKSLTEDNVKVIGAVVTGDVADLAVLEDQEAIRASAIGATASLYN